MLSEHISTVNYYLPCLQFQVETFLFLFIDLSESRSGASDPDHNYYSTSDANLLLSGKMGRYYGIFWSRWSLALTASTLTCLQNQFVWNLNHDGISTLLWFAWLETNITLMSSCLLTIVTAGYCVNLGCIVLTLPCKTRNSALDRCTVDRWKTIGVDWPVQYLVCMLLIGKRCVTFRVNRSRTLLSIVDLETCCGMLVLRRVFVCSSTRSSVN